jgi:threonine synthase
MEQHAAPEISSSTAVQRCILPVCREVYSTSERIYVCRRCGGPLEVELRLQSSDLQALKISWQTRTGSSRALDRSGVWRYRELLPFQDSAPIVTLFEGNTPVYEAPRCAEYCGITDLRLKHQGCNPTGSFKDTGMTVAITQAKKLGARTVICASTGNTAASMAAYAARAGMDAAILVPRGQVSAAKLAQSMDYGARILEIDGSFDVAMKLVRDLMDNASIYVANSVNPFRIEGQKTVAFELLAQSGWRVPDHVVVPGGNLGNSAALAKGFEELRGLGLIDRLPRLNVVQAEGAAPLATLFRKLDRQRFPNGEILPEEIVPVAEPCTLATAIRIGSPVSWRKSLRGVLRSNGQVIAASESEIADAKALIGRDGIGCEPASATTVAGIRKMVASGHIARNESVVGILTGHVLKDPDYVSRYHDGTLAVPAGRDAKSEERIEGKFRNVPERVPPIAAAVVEAIERGPTQRPSSQ